MIKFKQASDDDISQIQEVAAKTWPVAYGKILSAAQIEYMLDLFYSAAALEKSMQLQNYIFAVNGGKIIGFCGIEHHFHSSPTTRIHKLYILPEAQGLNAGRKFIEHITEVALESSSRKLSLNVNKYNSALQFYKKLGFQSVREETIDIGNGYLMEDFVMEKDI